VFEWLFGRGEGQTPFVQHLQGEVSYLREQLAHERARFEALELRYREELIAISNRHVAAELDWRRQPARPASTLRAEGAITGLPVDDDIPPYMANHVYGGDHLTEMESPLPENLNRTEDELADATIEHEMARREEERLLRVGA
jgi:hypothetical protein